MHPYLPQEPLRAWCAARSVAVTCYCPLGAPQRPPAFRHEGEPAVPLLEAPAVAAIAAAHGLPPAVVLLKWALQRGTVPLPKASTPAHIRENAGATRGPRLSHGDMAALSALSAGLPGVGGHRYSRGESYAPAGVHWSALWSHDE